MFEGKAVIVTGAAGGIGREIVRHFLTSGANVTGSDLAGRGAGTATDGLGDVADRYAAIDADIADERDVAALVSGAAERWGSIDVLVNVAAVTGAGLRDDGNLLEMTLESFDRIIAVNLRGTMLMCRHAIPVMLDHGGGAIVNISSRAAARGNLGFCAYSASKAGVNTLTANIAKAFGRQGIRCNGVMPGLITGTDSMAHESMTDAYLAAVERQSLVGRLGEPSDIAGMVAFLASDQAGFVNGQILSCDGGAGV